MIQVGKYSALLFGFGVNNPNYNCTGDQDMDYGVGASVNVGTQSLISCTNIGHGQTLTIGSPIVQNSHWVRGVWQQHDWETTSSYYYAGTQRTVYARNCYLEAFCDNGAGGHPDDTAYLLPRVTVTTSGATTTDITVRVEFSGDVLLPVDAEIILYKKDQNGVTTQIAMANTVPNQSSLSFGVNPSVNLTLQNDLSLDVWEFYCAVVATGYNTGFANCFLQLLDTADYLPPYVGENSFLQFDNVANDCQDDECICLPTTNPEEVVTAIHIDCTYTGWDATDLANMLNQHNNINTYAYWIGLCDDDCELINDPSENDYPYLPCLFTDWKETAVGSGILASYMNWQNTPQLAVDVRYRLCLFQRTWDSGGNYTDTKISCSSTCFYITTDECYTSLINYRSNEDGLCFYYTEFPQNYNTIRLPIYLGFPEYISKLQGYQKSNGSFVKLSERIEEIYKLKTDYMTEFVHKCLKYALAHDYIDIHYKGQQVAVYNDEAYDIKWNEDKQYPMAMAETKVKKSENNCSTNSNCK